LLGRLGHGDLLINLKTAAALGIAIPNEMLLRANGVIR
jgi:ABC-type uncharacterized transport system substrate-binding protein